MLTPKINVDTNNSGTSGDSVTGSEGPAMEELALLSIECAECNLFLLASRNRCILASSFLLRDHELLFDPSMAYSIYIQVINGLKRFSVHKNSVNRKTTTRTWSSLIMHALEYTGICGDIQII